MVRDNINSRLPCIDDVSCDETNDSKILNDRSDDRGSSKIDLETIQMNLQTNQVG